ncbi:diaminopimelate epimerase [Desulfobaculum xiamenense]|uniref:Diaminopimelate epimerase n=1 Tax=Desulfobaculum xiamenense TaxID=995050 RepID=A0A846QIH9_9BACT|nr:hypothetical protein [Desulfobaculum xiamenense]NJB68038.1 diaminopimelate epimerase [Desulfobaculum xiamenense]
MSARVPYRFVKVSPGGNTTILVMDPPAMSSRQRAEVAARLMDPLHLGAEQVGFVNTTSAIPRLDMMGGEFCGNAARSAALVLAMSGHPAMTEHDGLHTGRIEVSGADSPLDVYARIGGNPTAGIDIPLPAAGLSRHALGIHVARLDGITHVLLDEASSPFPENYAAYAATIRADLGLTQCEAAGCIWYSREKDGASIRPVVWVRETDTTYYETACGSGTVALALLMAANGHAGTVSVRQPSGSHIAATIRPNAAGSPESARIDGPVAIIATGTTYA